MHETAFAKKVIEEARKKGAKNFVEVEVGELCEIEAHEMKEALENLISWKINVSEIKGIIKCKKCNYKGKPNIIDKGHGYCYFNCPKCGASGKELEIIEGGEIKVVKIG